MTDEQFLTDDEDYDNSVRNHVPCSQLKTTEQLKNCAHNTSVYFKFYTNATDD